jgi:zinc transporter ZupT
LETTSVVTAFALTLFAGLSTGIGSALAFFTKKTNTKLLSVSLGFSAGVMIYISFVELFAESKALLISRLGSGQGYLVTVSVPIYFATGSKKKAFTYSFLSGLSEPVGAVIGYIILD